MKRGWELVFLRDWHPVLRDPLDLVRLSFGVGAVIYALLGDWDAAVRLFAPGVSVFLVRAIDVPRPVDWVFCAAMVFQGWGNALHLFSEFWWYDNCVHITLPMSLAPILYIGFARLDVVPDPSERAGSTSSCWGWPSSPVPRGDRGQLLRDLRMGGRQLVRPAPVHRRDRHHHRPRRRLPRRRHRRAVPGRVGAHALHEPPPTTTDPPSTTGPS